MKEEWINNLRKKMDDYQQSAPELSWDAIEKAVAEQGAPSTGSSQKRHQAKIVPLWFRRTAAAAMILLVAGIGFYMIDRLESPTTQIASNGGKPVTTSAVSVPGSTAEQEETLMTAQADDSHDNPLTQIADKVSRALRGKTIYRSETHQLAQAHLGDDTRLAVEASPAMQEMPSTPQGNVETPSSPAQTAQSSATKAGNKPQETTHPSKSYAYKYYYDTRQHTTKGKQDITVKVYYSGGFADNHSAVNSVFAKTWSDAACYNAKSSVLAAAVPDEKVKTKHRQPVRIGTSVRIPISDKWSVDAGVSYTYLASDITKNAGELETKTHQTLHYVGIPVSANYRLTDGRRFHLYLKAGGMAERMVKGNTSTTSSAKGISQGPEEGKVKIGGLQYSVNAGVGAEYKIVSNVYAFAEPGVAYYFDNGSHVKTIYQDKPVNFDMHLGVRINLK